MKLVKIKEDLYLNPNNVQSVEFDDEDNTTLITMVNGEVFSLKLPTKKVLDAICGSEEHLVNDASMNILKAESINSGHLNQQKYPSR
ncbi:hypothetical protein [Pediococcus pentosaceus]|uniref:hypothetical protein n=1 Tax=Pediococcus pentosaceus TaxID=1255 RepID=UPI000DFC5F22|nr:hypothetical protein [Pediococcus pentosaceus]AXR43536.1 hypothetical protein CKK51_05205 [Pediococcus pentosaceus]KAF0520025.1 hypothetical protein GBP31_01715 [Pediococcus pentosaceus]MBF7102272.1 hypothetical protein [Pediococcus pentosaceus]MBF7110733.1 hypothetical protein [Pediococcus pentosaceus]MBF7117705.1 hypothetical protein [Pediococcus pentosaceus]